MKLPLTKSRIALLASVLTLALAAGSGAALAQRPPAPPADGWASAASSQLFHITLVAASKGADGGKAEELPKAVAKALDDIRDFLPYKGYRVLDAALVRGSSEAETMLAGLDEHHYDAVMSFRLLHAEPAGEPEKTVYLIDSFELRPRPDFSELRGPDGTSGRKVANPIALAARTTLSASFRIARGETVVVGSSRVDGSEDAMIVLLTAVP